jgi:metal-sulfur cluster biosynthetic enzyme
MTTVEQVYDSLRAVTDPCSAATGSDLDIVEMGLVKSVAITDGHVRVRIRLTTPACQMIPYFLVQIREHVGAIPDVAGVDVDTDDGTEWSEEMMSAEAQSRRQEVLDGYRTRYEQRS